MCFNVIYGLNSAVFIAVLAQHPLYLGIVDSGPCKKQVKCILSWKDSEQEKGKGSRVERINDTKNMIFFKLLTSTLPLA